MSERDEAIRLMESGNYAGAVSLFERLLGQSSRDWSLYYMAGQCARFAGDTKKAVYFHQRAASINPNEPQVYLALGIGLQLAGNLGEAVEAFRSALELDGDMVLAYNSLGITQKKMGELELARHNLEEGIKALGRSIARGLKNARSIQLAPLPATQGTQWAQVALAAAMYLCASESGISRLAWPDGKAAVREVRGGQSGGLFWVDNSDRNNETTRVFLPNFFHTVHLILRRDSTYANLLGNLGSVLQLLGNDAQAEQNFAEAQEFMGGRGAG